MIWHLTEIEKGFLRKGTLLTEYVGVPLPKIKVLWRKNKQGGGSNKAKKDLLLNKLTAFQENSCLVCTVDTAEGSWPRLGPLWEAFHKMGLSRHALGQSCLIVVMYNGRATYCVTMQFLHWVNVIHACMISHTIIPNIATVHKRVKNKMDDKSKLPHKFTDLCRELMWLISKATDPVLSSKPLFNTIIPIVSGLQSGSTIIIYRTDNKVAAILIHKIKRTFAAWFFGYWCLVSGYKLEMVRKLMESFDVDTALLVCFSEFDPKTLTIQTTFGDMDEKLESCVVDLGIDQGLQADAEEGDGSRVDLVGHCKALEMTLRDQIKDVDDAAHSGPSCCLDFLQSAGNSTNNTDVTIRQHTLKAKALSI
jgi:hypothetical protein